MANRYWVNGNGLWNASNVNNWSANPGGGPGASVPTSADDVFFNSQSGGAADVRVEQGFDAICRNLTFTGFTGRLRANVSGSTTYLDIYGNLALDGTSSVYGSTFELYSIPTNQFAITFLGTTAKTVTTSGKTLPAVSVSGSSSTTLLDSLNAYYVSQVSSSTLTLNNFDVNVRSFSTSSGSTRTLNLGSGTITLSNASGGDWTIGNTGTLILDAGTSTIILSSPSNQTFTGGDKVYYNVVFGGSNTKTIYGSNTYNNVSTTTNSLLYILFQAFRTSTVSNFNISGSPGNLVYLGSHTPNGSQTTFSKASGTVTVNYLEIKDTNATGGATWYYGTDIVDLGNNTGWVIPPLDIPLTGIQTSGEVGTVESNQIANISNVSAIEEIGFVQSVTSQSADIVNVVTSGEAGLLNFNRTPLQISQVSSTGQIGSVEAFTSQGADIFNVVTDGQAGLLRYTNSRAVSNTSTTGEVGEFGVFNGIIVAVSGVQTNGAVGSFSIPWYPMSTAQTANWGNIGTAQTASWTNIN